MFYLNWFGFPALVCSLAIIAIGFCVLLQNPRGPTHRALFYFCLSLFVWLFGYSAVYFSKDPEVALFWGRTSFLGIAFISSTNLYFNLTFIGVKNRKTLIGFAFATSLFYALLSYTPYIYSGVKSFFWGYYTQIGALHPSFLIIFILIWSYSLYRLYKSMQEKKKCQDFNAYNRTKSMFIAWTGGVVGMLDFLPNYGIGNYPFGCFVALYWTFTCAMALLNYNKPNLNFLTRKCLIGGYIAAGLMLLYICNCSLKHAFAFYGNSKAIPALTMIIGSLATVVFFLLCKGIKAAIDKIFFPEYFKRDDALAKCGTELASVKNQNQCHFSILLKNIYALFGTMKSSLYVFSVETNEYRMTLGTECGIIFSVEHSIAVTRDHPIVRHLTDRGVLDFDQIKQEPRISARDIKSMLLWSIPMESTLIVPIMVDGILSAFIVLGEKESGLSYTQKDKADLTHIANLSAIVSKSEHLYQYQLELKKMVDEKTQELKKAEEELIKKEKLAAIGLLANEVSHELRNPLRSFETNNVILEKKLRENFDIMLLLRIEAQKKDIQSMKRIVNNMLDYTRARSLKLEKCQLNQLVLETLALTEKPSGVKVNLNLSAAVSECWVDVQEMRQAFLNLFLNACEAMTDGGELCVQTNLLAQDLVEIIVSDTGCGIRQEHLDKIFEPFHSTKVCGNGLGMAVVKKVIEHHNGTVSVKSRPGEGTTFILRCPVAVCRKLSETLNGLSEGNHEQIVDQTIQKSASQN